MGTTKPLILAGLIGLQVLILIGMFVKAYYPIFTGKEVFLKVQPMDPRDIFRGNYSALRYDFTTVELQHVPNDLDTGKIYSFGDVLYAELKPQDEGKLSSLAGVWQSPKENGNLFLKCHVKSYYKGYENFNTLELTAGIESFFASVEKAKSLDSLMLQSRFDTLMPDVYVRAMVAPNGQARLTSIHCDEAGL